MPISSKDDVIRFLDEFKKAVSEKPILGGYPRFVARDKNTAGISALGITQVQACQEVMGLNASDYCLGPDSDTGEGGYVWVFGKEVSGIETYIKLKLREKMGIKWPVVLSFHPADTALTYPYEENEERDETDER